jgi:hypothetical protein
MAVCPREWGPRHDGEPVYGLSQVQDVTKAVIPVVSEAEMAEFLREQGQRVIRHRGRYWQQMVPGFYRPVHPLARLSAEQATRPTAASWGFQACLTEDDAHLANAHIPMNLVTDVDRFDETTLTSDRRRRLRRARDNARIVQLTGPALVRDQGYDLLVSALERTGHGRLPTRKKYLASLERWGEPAWGIALGALFEGRLGGYITGHAVDRTAYAGEIVVATWALKTHISAGLTYEFLNACKRAGSIREMQHGLHVRENEGLCKNKELLGLPLRRLPSKLGLIPGAAPLIRRHNPHKYYRLTGRD